MDLKFPDFFPIQVFKNTSRVVWSNQRPTWKFAIDPKLKKALIDIRDDAKTNGSSVEVDYGLPRKAATLNAENRPRESLVRNIYSSQFPQGSADGVTSSSEPVESVPVRDEGVFMRKVAPAVNSMLTVQHGFAAMLFLIASYYTYAVIRLKYGLGFDPTWNSKSRTIA